jgi:hypothetical protein
LSVWQVIDEDWAVFFEKKQIQGVGWSFREEKVSEEQVGVLLRFGP